MRFDSFDSYIITTYLQCDYSRNRKANQVNNTTSVNTQDIFEYVYYEEFNDDVFSVWQKRYPEADREKYIGVGCQTGFFEKNGVKTDETFVSFHLRNIHGDITDYAVCRESGIDLQSQCGGFFYENEQSLKELLFGETEIASVFMVETPMDVIALNEIIPEKSRSTIFVLGIGLSLRFEGDSPVDDHAGYTQILALLKKKKIESWILSAGDTERNIMRKLWDFNYTQGVDSLSLLIPEHVCGLKTVSVRDFVYHGGRFETLHLMSIISDEKGLEKQAIENGYICGSDCLKQSVSHIIHGIPSVKYFSDEPDGPLRDFFLRPGTLTFIASHPGAAKTAFIMQALMGFVRLNPDLKILVANTEQSPETLINREISRQFDLPYDLVLENQLHELDHHKRLRDHFRDVRNILKNIYFHKNPRNVIEVLEMANVVQADIILLDYIQSFKVENLTSETDDHLEKMDERVALGHMLNVLTECIQESNKAIVAISSVPRNKSVRGTYSRLDLGSLSGSSQLEYRATNIYLLQNPSMKTGSGTRILERVKAKEDPPIEIPLYFNGSRMRFENPKEGEGPKKPCSSKPKKSEPKVGNETPKKPRFM